MQQTQMTQGAAFRPPLLDLKQVAKLCDAAMYAFGVLADVEREAKKTATTRLKAEMKQLDLFGPRLLHYSDVEEYTPFGGEDRCRVVIRSDCASACISRWRWP
jgi:hypothetical protein